MHYSNRVNLFKYRFCDENVVITDCKWLYLHLTFTWPVIRGIWTVKTNVLKGFLNSCSTKQRSIGSFNWTYKINMILLYTEIHCIYWDIIWEDGVVWPHLTLCSIFSLDFDVSLDEALLCTSAIGYNAISSVSNNHKWYTVYMLEHLHRWVQVYTKSQWENLEDSNNKTFLNKNKENMSNYIYIKECSV